MTVRVTSGMFAGLRAAGCELRANADALFT
jgi:hypothetical protein